MKPGSIIFLIVSVFIIITGLVLCTIGGNIAKEQNIALFSTDISVVNGDVIRSEILDDTAINKVKMNLDHVNIHILHSETGNAYLELRNFQVGTYDYSVQNKMLLIDNETSIFSLMRIAEGNFNFNGLRHYLTYRSGKNTQKELYLYLTDDASVNSFDITCKRGTVTLENLSFSTDYNVTLSAGDIVMNSISTKSIINLSTNKGIITLNDVAFRQGNIVVGKGAADLYIHGIPFALEVLVEEGDIDCGYKAANDYGLKFVLDANGTVTYNGTEQTDRPYIFSNSPTPYTQSLSSESGNINCAIGATGISGRFHQLSEALAKEAETEDLDAVETVPPQSEAVDSHTTQNT